MYITDKAKVFRKSHISLRPNFNVREFSATPGKIGEKLQRRTILRPATQNSTSPASTSPANLLEVVDLTAESSNEDSITAGPSLEQVEATGTTPWPLHKDKTGSSHIHIPTPRQANENVGLEAATSAPLLRQPKKGH